MRANYDDALRRLLKHEGGYTNHPSDPGGPTNYGITIHDVRKYVKKDATAADVRALQRSQAAAIYKEKYWDALRCDELPPGVDYSIFDYGVNSGIGRSGKVLRRMLGMADSTHVVTDAVLKAVAKHDPSELVIQINDERLRFLKRLKTWPVFGAGWGRRVAEVKAQSLRLAAAPVEQPPPPDIEPVEDRPNDRPTGKPPWWKRLWLRWFGGGVGTYLGLSTFTDAQVAAVMMGGAFLIVALSIGAVMIFIGSDGRAAVRGWIVRQFKD